MVFIWTSTDVYIDLNSLLTCHFSYVVFYGARPTPQIAEKVDDPPGGRRKNLRIELKIGNNIPRLLSNPPDLVLRIASFSAPQTGFGPHAVRGSSSAGLHSRSSGGKCCFIVQM